MRGSEADSVVMNLSGRESQMRHSSYGRRAITAIACGGKRRRASKVCCIAFLLDSPSLIVRSPCDNILFAPL